MARVVVYTTAALTVVVALSCRPALPVREGYMRTDDSVRLYYRIVGSGDETVIAPVASFHTDRLDALARSRRIVLYDPRGRGRSDAVPPAKVSLEHNLRDLETVRRAVGAERVALIGWSGLGMELFVYTLRNPDRVTRLVHLAPVAPRRDPYSDRMIQSRVSRMDTAAFRGLDARREAGEFNGRDAEYCRELNRITLPATFSSPTGAVAAPDVCRYENEWWDNLGPYFDALLGSIGAFDWRSDLTSVRIPRLVIHGADDNIPLEGNREWVAGQPNTRLLVIPGAGHWPLYEQPDLVIRALERFLSGGWPEGAESIP